MSQPKVLPLVDLLQARRVALIQNRPPQCPSCYDEFQIQLEDSHSSPAAWRCRSCNTRWQWEPPGIPNL